MSIASGSRPENKRGGKSSEINNDILGIDATVSLASTNGGEGINRWRNRSLYQPEAKTFGSTDKSFDGKSRK